MTKDEKNRKIAEFLEPHADLDPEGHTDRDCSWHGRLSPKGAWYRHYRFQYGFEWRPLDFFTDEDANAMVLEAMPTQVMLERFYGGGLVILWKVHDMTLSAIGKILAMEVDRKTAICEAFIKWKEA